MILVTQMFFELGPFSRVIRNQLNAVVLFRNFGDCKINRRVASQMGVLDQYVQAEKATKNKKFDPIVILSGEIVAIQEMRVQTDYLNNCVSYCYL